MAEFASDLGGQIFPYIWGHMFWLIVGGRIRIGFWRVEIVLDLGDRICVRFGGQNLPQKWETEFTLDFGAYFFVDLGGSICI